MTHLERLMYFMKATQINQYANKKEAETFVFMKIYYHS